MKKILALITSIAMLAAFTGCSSKNDAAADTSSAAEVTTTTATSETEAAEEAVEETTAAETEAPVETEAETATEASGSGDLQAVLDSKSDGLWAVDLNNKITAWENNVKLEISYAEDDMSIRLGMHTLGDKFDIYSDFAGMFVIRSMYDGTNTYLIDDATSTYCIDTSGEKPDTMNTDEFLLKEDAVDNYTSSGIEEINGVEYIYEEYKVDDSVLRYYFDEYANVKYVGSDDDGVKTYIEFTVEFADEPDEEAFKVPEGYKEVTEEEYAMNAFAALMPEE